MNKTKILSAFTKETQCWKIVNHILTFGNIKNFEIHTRYNITCHTARLTEIRYKLYLVGYELIATQISKTNTWVYTITTLGGVIEYESN